MVDGPYDFGRVAAANALSDVWAMGGVPLIALNIVCFPDADLDVEVLRETLRGGHDVVHAAGAVIGGGHSVSDPEFKYGLSVTGTVHPERIWDNAGALPGDLVVLTKPVGTGVLSTALKWHELDGDTASLLVEAMAALNRGAADAARSLFRPGEPDPIHAVTDVTGFGLLGHAIEVARASSVRLRLRAGEVPLLPAAAWAAREGYVTGGGESGNLAYLGEQALFAPSLDPALRSLMLDPQTSGGLLLFVDEARAGDLVAALVAAGAPCAAVVGEVEGGEPGIEVLP